MMSYASQQDMVLEFGDREVKLLTDRNNQGSIDTSVLQGALDYADDLIDAHLRSVVNTPLATPVPGEILNIALDLARYRLYDRGETPQVVKDRNDQALRLLRDYRDGKLQLPAGLAADEAAEGQVDVLRDDADRKFTLGSTWPGFEL